MTDLNLLAGEFEDDLRGTVRDFLADRCDSAALTRIYDGDRSVVSELQHGIGTALGLSGLLVPEERGGSGATAVEAAVVLEELGRAAAPVPFLTSAVVATTILLETDSDLVSDLAAGSTVAALTVPLSTGPGAQLATVRGDEVSLRGTVTSVAGAIEADELLVPVADGDAVALYVVPAAAATVTPVVSLDMTRQLADVRLDGARGVLLLGDAESTIRTALEVGAALLASEQLGVARWCLDATVAHLKERRQFGRVVGGFQALKHRLADLYASVESAAATARYAAATVAAGDPDAAVATALAQAYCSDVAVHAAEEAVQLHGGLGITWEHPAHLYLKRAKADQIAFGTAAMHRAALAGLIDLPS